MYAYMWEGRKSLGEAVLCCQQSCYMYGQIVVGRLEKMCMARGIDVEKL